VKRIVVDVLKVSEDEVVLEASFLEDLGADSLDFVNLREGFEKEFSDENRTLEFLDDEAQNFLTVQQVVVF
jgi:acyl carrier protein